MTAFLISRCLVLLGPRRAAGAEIDNVHPQGASRRDLRDVEVLAWGSMREGM